MPFADRLDIQIPWLFYAVPATNPGGIDTVFTDRFWDFRENWLPPGVGVVPGSMKIYEGAIPSGQLGPIYGTPDQWINGLDYDVWQAGGYAGTPCWQPGTFTFCCPTVGLPATLTATIEDVGGLCSCYAGTFTLTEVSGGWTTTVAIDCGGPYSMTVQVACQLDGWFLEMRCGDSNSLIFIAGGQFTTQKCWPFLLQGEYATFDAPGCCVASGDTLKVTVTI